MHDDIGSFNNYTANELGDKPRKKVTLGWDSNPTILNDDGTIYPRSVELILNKQHYPNWPIDKWPIDPENGDKLEMCEPRNFKPKHMESTKLNWTALIIGSILGFLAVFTDDSTLVAALEMSPKTIGWIKIVAYVVSPLLIMYNGAQVFIKNNRNHG